MVDRRAYGVPELADSWAVSKQYLYKLIADGDLAAFHVGRRVVVPVDEVERFERAHRVVVG